MQEKSDKQAVTKTVQKSKPRATPKTATPRTSVPKSTEPSASDVAPKTESAATVEPELRTGDPGAKKRPAKKSARIVTKDTEFEKTAGTAATIAPYVIDESVFDDDVTEEPVTGYYHKSMTIDNTMLSREAAAARKRSGKRRKQKDN